MKANELRIGNYFKDEAGNTLNVFGITDSSHEHGGIIWYDNELGFYVKLEEAIPIPLTPELLEKCGFRKQGFVDYVLNGVKISYDNAEKRFVSFNSMMRMVIVASLHQLQNLFYALTGEELQISL